MSAWIEYDQIMGLMSSIPEPKTRLGWAQRSLVKMLPTPSP